MVLGPFENLTNLVLDPLILPTHLHHGRAMPRLMGGILMLGEKGVMVAMGHGLCVCLCVCEKTTKNKVGPKKSKCILELSNHVRFAIVGL
jgi:hypothetical protein